jgi:hypothetical protein
MHRTATGVGLFGKVIPLIVLAAFIVPLCCCDLPSDRELTDSFVQKRTEFENLRKMVEEDDLEGRIHAQYADPKLSPERLEQYRALMKDIGVMRLWANGKKEPFELIVDGTGFLAQGDYKGYMFNPEKPAPFFQSLDRSCFESNQILQTERSCRAASSLDNGWWLIRYEYR